MYNGEYGVSTDENGLYYMRARYYNPEIKRFINQDVVIGSIVDSPSLNRYAYVEGNPISLADPFGLSPAINWGRAGHTILNILGLFTFVPGLNWIGIAANAINAVWYFAEGNIFNGICSGLAALPGIGGAIGKIGSAGKFSNAASMIQKGTQIASNVGFMSTGAYTIGKMGYDNYQKYVVRGEDFSFWDFAGDAVNGAFAVLSIYGGAKDLGFDKINVSTKLKGCVYIGGSNFNANNTKDIYRAVSLEEYEDIMKTGKFRGIEGSLAAKEFGNDFNETLIFADKPINVDKVAIIKVTIPENVYDQLHHMRLDPYIFKSGTPVVEPEMLDIFNDSIINIEHVF